MSVYSYKPNFDVKFLFLNIGGKILSSESAQHRNEWVKTKGSILIMECKEMSTQEKSGTRSEPKGSEHSWRNTSSGSWELR